MRLIGYLAFLAPLLASPVLAQGTANLTNVMGVDSGTGAICIVSQTPTCGLPTLPPSGGGSTSVTNAGTFAVQNTAATPAGTNNIGNLNPATIAKPLLWRPQ